MKISNKRVDLMGQATVDIIKVFEKYNFYISECNMVMYEVAKIVNENFKTMVKKGDEK